MKYLKPLLFCGVLFFCGKVMGGGDVKEFLKGLYVGGGGSIGYLGQNKGLYARDLSASGVVFQYFTSYRNQGHKRDMGKSLMIGYKIKRVRIEVQGRHHVFRAKRFYYVNEAWDMPPDNEVMTADNNPYRLSFKTVCGNIYYDIKMGENWELYVGGGIGKTTGKIGGVIHGTGVSGSKSVFCMQGMMGVTYKLHENIKLYLGGALMNTRSFNFKHHEDWDYNPVLDTREWVYYKGKLLLKTVEFGVRLSFN